MARLVNHVTISGYIQGEVRVLGKDKNVAKFTVKYPAGRKVDDKWVNEPEYYDVTGFKDDVERMLEVSAGDMVLVTGRLKQDRWEKDGQKRSTVGIILQSFAKVPTDTQVNTSQDDDIPQSARDFLDVS